MTFYKGYFPILAKYFLQVKVWQMVMLLMMFRKD